MKVFAATLLGGMLAAAPVLGQAPAAPAPPAKAPAKAPAAPKAPATPKAPEYDPKAEVTFKGTVEDFHESQVRGDHPGLHLIVRTETESIEVHACPVRFMKELDFAIEKGDAVTVIGSRPGGTGVVVAREITKGQTSLTLREKSGAPIWVGR